MLLRFSVLFIGEVMMNMDFFCIFCTYVMNGFNANSVNDIHFHLALTVSIFNAELVLCTVNQLPLVLITP